MGLFKKKWEKKEFKELIELPKLPRLPALPEEIESKKTLPQLPRYPINSLIDRFSQNTIKEAVTGEKEEIIEADEFVREQIMPEHSEIKPSSRLNLEFPYKMERINSAKNLELRSWQESKTKKSGQVFIKIDKFEESLKIFELIKIKIVDMEKLLEDIKEIKEKEEKELSYWMSEIQTIKNQTEKVERDIFSKIE